MHFTIATTDEKKKKKRERDISNEITYNQTGQTIYGIISLGSFPSFAVHEFLSESFVFLCNYRQQNRVGYWNENRKK
jgi:hypothetical protein